jgi:hypothetical protein
MKILGPATVFGPIILIILTILMGLVFASPPTSSSAISMTVNEAILVFIFVVIGAALFAAGGVFLIAVMRTDMTTVARTTITIALAFAVILITLVSYARSEPSANFYGRDGSYEWPSRNPPRTFKQ